MIPSLPCLFALALTGCGSKEGGRSDSETTCQRLLEHLHEADDDAGVQVCGRAMDANASCRETVDALVDFLARNPVSAEVVSDDPGESGELGTRLLKMNAECGPTMARLGSDR